MWRRTIGQVVLAVLVAVAAAGCGSSDQDGSAGAPASTAAPATTTTTPPATASSSSTTTASVAAARCSNGVLLEAAQQALRESGSTVTIASVTVARCRNGYALLSAHPASGNVESPNVFLVWRRPPRPGRRWILAPALTVPAPPSDRNSPQPAKPWATPYQARRQLLANSRRRENLR